MPTDSNPCHWLICSRWRFILCVVIGCASLAFGNSVNCFGNYANSLKEKFGLTQTQLQVIGAVLELSANIGFPAGWLLARFGSRVTFLAAMLITSSGYFVLWIAAIFWQTFYRNIAFICGVFIVIGFGSAHFITASYAILVRNVSSQHTGKILCGSCLASSAFQIGLTAFYGRMFIKEPQTVDRNITSALPSQTQHLAQTENNFTVFEVANTTLEDDHEKVAIYVSSMQNNFHYFFCIMAIYGIVISMLAIMFVKELNHEENIDDTEQKQNLNEERRNDPHNDLEKGSNTNDGENLKLSQNIDDAELKQKLDDEVRNDPHVTFGRGSNTDVRSSKELQITQIEKPEKAASRKLENCFKMKFLSQKDKTFTQQDIQSKDPAEKASFVALKGWSLLKNVEFNLIVWPWILTGAANVALIYNLTSMMRSFGLEEHATLLMSIMFFSWVLTRIPIFIFIDWVPNKSIFTVLGALSLLCSFVILPFYGDKLVLFIVSVVLSGLSNASCWTSGPSLLTKFGLKYYGYNYGWVVFGYGLLGLSIQALTGYLYDINIDTTVTLTCYGLQCFTKMLLFSAGLCLFSVVMSMVHVIKFSKP